MIVSLEGRGSFPRIIILEWKIFHRWMTRPLMPGSFIAVTWDLVVVFVSTAIAWIYTYQVSTDHPWEHNPENQTLYKRNRRDHPLKQSVLCRPPVSSTMEMVAKCSGTSQ